jgi:hypothetical protein
MIQKGRNMSNRDLVVDVAGKATPLQSLIARCLSANYPTIGDANGEVAAGVAAKLITVFDGIGLKVEQTAVKAPAPTKSKVPHAGKYGFNLHADEAPPAHEDGFAIALETALRECIAVIDEVSLDPHEALQLVREIARRAVKA